MSCDPVTFRRSTQEASYLDNPVYPRTARCPFERLVEGHLLAEVMAGDPDMINADAHWCRHLMNEGLSLGIVASIRLRRQPVPAGQRR